MPPGPRHCNVRTTGAQRRPPAEDRGYDIAAGAIFEMNSLLFARSHPAQAPPYDATYRLPPAGNARQTALSSRWQAGF